jgi:hypothetical protein
VAVTIDPQDSRIYDGPNTILFPSDSAGRASAFLSGLDLSDNIVLASFTADRKLRVDASVSIDSVDIGDVNMRIKLVGGGEAYVFGALNPDALSYFAYVQDQRMTFTSSALNVHIASGLTSPTDVDDDSVVAGQIALLGLNLNYGYNGVDWERLTTTTGSLNVNVTGGITTPIDTDDGSLAPGQTVNLSGSLLYGYNGADWERIKSFSGRALTTTDGVYDAAINTDPSNVGLVGMVRNAVPADSQQTRRITAVQDASGDTRALDVALHDELGEPYSSANPLPVASVDVEAGTKIHDYDPAVGIAALGGTDNHDYTVTVGKTLKFKQVIASASDKMKVEVQIGPSGGPFITKAVLFSTATNTIIDETFADPIDVASGNVVRLIRTNRDNLAQDLYSTIVGTEI